MKKVHIFYTRFVTDDGKITVGGVQTYLINLTKVLNDLSFEVHYYRPSTMDFETEHYNIKMHGYDCRPIKKTDKKIAATFEHFKNRINKETDIVIFADELESCKTKGYKTIALQHGIFWDIPVEEANNGKIKFFNVLAHKIVDIVRRLIHSNYAKVLVCVDYNYVNWYRAVMPCLKTNLIVNPNFSTLYPDVEKPKGIINIIFARRFETFRGTRIFCGAIKKLFEQNYNIHVTLAGWGADEKWLHEQLDKYGEKVEFTTYKSEDSFKMHSDKHIAVVPTTGSEGTSLSLLEAMSSHCAVIGSDVGGITNIIIDGFNGLMVPAGDEKRLLEALKYLIDKPEEIRRLADMGYKTVEKSFSYDRWKMKWESIINDVVN